MSNNPDFNIKNELKKLSPEKQFELSYFISMNTKLDKQDKEKAKSKHDNLSDELYSDIKNILNKNINTDDSIILLQKFTLQELVTELNFHHDNKAKRITNTILNIVEEQPKTENTLNLLYEAIDNTACYSKPKRDIARCIKNNFDINASLKWLEKVEHNTNKSAWDIFASKIAIEGSKKDICKALKIIIQRIIKDKDINNEQDMLQVLASKDMHNILKFPCMTTLTHAYHSVSFLKKIKWLK